MGLRRRRLHYLPTCHFGPYVVSVVSLDLANAGLEFRVINP
jgi:hypothetical protein